MDPMPLAEAREKFPPMWTIYANPSDYPGKHVVRVWYGETPDERATVCKSLTDAREFVRNSGGCMRTLPSPGDDPCIVETWL